MCGHLACSNTIAVLQNRKAILTAGGAAQNTARGAQVHYTSSDLGKTSL